MAALEEPEYLSLTSLKFINLPGSLQCVQCQNPVLRPRQTPCGHLVCTECVTALRKLGRCPSDDHDEGDCIDITTDTIFNKDNSAIRELKKLKTFCPFNSYGCKEVLAYKDIKTHTERCQYKKSPCPHEGCDVGLTDSDRQDHLNICQYRPVNCDHCGESIALNKKREHLRECQKVPITCRNNCGSTVPKDQMENHVRDNCYKGSTPCPLATLGCAVESERQDMPEHMNTHAHRHWEMAIHTISTLDLKVVRLQNQLMDTEQKFKCENTQLKSQIQEKSSEVQRLNESLNEEKKKHSKLRGDLEAGNGHLSDAVSKMSAILAGLERKVTQLSLQQQNRTATEGANSLRSLPFLQEQIGMLDMRLQCQETTSYNGTLIWRISDYRKRKDDALKGTTLSLYSQPFYTSRDGYKMCCRIYLNGDGLGKGKYVSLFFVLMKGDYDPLLRWPFQQKVIMTLLHQDRGEDLWDTFDPDVTSSSFQRPQREMNVASGCPMFAKHDDIEKHSSKYLVDDTMFLRIEVNSSDCHIPSRRR